MNRQFYALAFFKNIYGNGQSDEWTIHMHDLDHRTLWDDLLDLKDDLNDHEFGKWRKHCGYTCWIIYEVVYEDGMPVEPPRERERHKVSYDAISPVLTA